MNRKSKTTAALLALFGGAFGVHKFYLNRPGQGVFFIIAFTVFFKMSFLIGAVFNAIEAARIFMMPDEDFEREYNSGTKEWESFRNKRNNRRASRTTRTSRNSGSSRASARSSRRSTSDRDARTTTSRSTRTRPQQERRTTRTRRSRPKDNPFKQSGIRRFKEYDIKGAIEDFQKALKIDGQDAAIHFNIAAAYSLNEEKQKAYNHLSQAVSYGMNDAEKIQTHEAFAYLRIQDDWQEFVDNGFKVIKAVKSIAPESADNLLEDDVLLAQLNKLKELRDKGLLTEAEYSLQKERLRS